MSGTDKPAPASSLAGQAAVALARVVANKRPQDTPKPPRAGTVARTRFIKNRGW